MILHKSICHKLSLKKTFICYVDDKSCFQKLRSSFSGKTAHVFDVGCGDRNFSDFFEGFGADSVSSDHEFKIIKEKQRLANETGSYVLFIKKNRDHIDKMVSKSRFYIKNLNWFDFFSSHIPEQIIPKYTTLFNHNGVLVFIQNSNFWKNIRKSHIRKYSIIQLTDKDTQLNCQIDHRSSTIYEAHTFTNISTTLFLFVIQITGLTCNNVPIISQKEEF